jgi:hypothetical protein
MVSQMADFTSSRAFRVAGPTAFAEAGITRKDADHLMIYDARGSPPGASFAHLPIYGLEYLVLGTARSGRTPGDARRGRPFHRRAQHRPSGKLPLKTNGGGLSYMHSGMYALQESVRQMRGIAPAQIPGAKILVCQGVGGMFAASGTIIMSNEVQLRFEQEEVSSDCENR